MDGSNATAAPDYPDGEAHVGRSVDSLSYRVAPGVITGLEADRNSFRWIVIGDSEVFQLTSFLNRRGAETQRTATATVFTTKNKKKKNIKAFAVLRALRVLRVLRGNLFAVLCVSAPLRLIVT